jgi:type IV fimbrial biogenesis protein FimT
MRSKGFTLVELMIVIALVAILTALALPSFQSSLRSNRVATAANEMMASIALARSEAVRNARGSGLCTSANGANCGGTWDDGWIVWIDDDANGTPGGPNDRVVRYTAGNDKLVITATASTGANNVILFDGRGRQRANVDRTITVSSDVCPTNSQFVRNIDINAAGQVRIKREACP